MFNAVIALVKRAMGVGAANAVSDGRSNQQSAGASLAANTTPPTVDVREVQDAAIAADLFRRKFAQEIPDFPKHFVAMIGERCAGYVHYTPWQGDYLCGGLCIDDRVYRSLDAASRAWIRERGGIAEIMMRAAHAALPDAPTIWGYIGDKQAEVVDRRVGFVPVAEPYLFAIWQKPLSDEAKATRIAEALKLGPF
jgi:hypothetical protein